MRYVNPVHSCTDNPLYSFYIPIVAYAWRKLGVIYPFFFLPKEKSKSMQLAMDYSGSISWWDLDYAADRQPTYFQCARLFPLTTAYLNKEDHYFIISDIDMIAFKPLIDAIESKLTTDNFVIAGADLTPESQYPMCYAAATVKTWEKVFGTATTEQALSKLLDEIKVDNMRGNFWCKDQETLKNTVDNSGVEIVKIDRRISNTQRTARNRADRDGRNFENNGLWDAHLKRPGYSEENFKTILSLLKEQYPQDNFDWLIEYRNKFVELL